MPTPGFLDRLVENPKSFTWLRKIAEANFVAVRRIVRQRLALDGQRRTLDLGCGTGELAPLFPENGYVGLDLSLRYIDYARRRHPAYRFGVADATAIPLSSGSCDQVLIFGVLHHLEDPICRAAAGEVARVLKPGGRFLLIEDSSELRRWNLPGRLMHAIDAGEKFRNREGYLTLIPTDRLSFKEGCRFASGLCEYEGLLFEREDQAND